MKLKANGLEFHLLTTGSSDKLILFLHGFPDDARSFTPIMENLSGKGYYCVAPYMRGYAPTQVPQSVKDSPFATVQIADLARDALGIINALKSQRSVSEVHLVGHDWGAIAAYGAVNYSPQTYNSAVMMSVPPGPTFLRNLIMNPLQFARSWYILFFQLPFFPETTIESGQGEFIRKLWGDWSGDISAYETRISEVIETLEKPDSLRAALAYYRGLLRPPVSEWAHWNESRGLILHDVRVRSLVLAGENDNCIAPEMFSSCEDDLAVEGSRFEKIKNAGHFLPLEAREILSKKILEFIQNP